MRRIVKVLTALACTLAAVSTMTGCSKATDNAPPAAPAPLSPQQQAQADQMAAGRQADAQKAAAARTAAGQPSSP